MSNSLLHVGYRKAGSTFIRDWFYTHPELKMGGMNINSEFCRYDYYEKRPKYFVFTDAFLLFKGNSPSRSIANLKKYQRDTCLFLKELFPLGKVLLITRSPETSIPSEYSEHIKNGGTLTFQELITNPEAIEYFIGYYDYNYSINLYNQTFGKENIIVLPMELLESSPDVFITTIEDRLGLLHHEFAYNKRNPSLPANKLAALRKISMLVKRVSKLFGEYGNNILGSYISYLGKESYSNNKFPLLIGLVSLLSKQPTSNTIVPEDLVRKIKSNATVLKDYPEFQNYLAKYCLD